MATMQPLKVTARLLTGRIATTDLYVPLDSILAHVWMMRHHPERMVASASAVRPEELIDPDLPFERRGQGADWYWACSFACGTPRAEDIAHWHKRFDILEAERYVDFGGRCGKVNTKSGFYKTYRVPVVTFLVPELVWYAVGDMDTIRCMVQTVTHIGKKRAQGYGRVARWYVEAWPEDLSHLRAIPDPLGEEMGIRPPYWLSWQWRPAVVSDDPRLACNYVGGTLDDKGTDSDIFWRSAVDARVESRGLPAARSR